MEHFARVRADFMVLRDFCYCNVNGLSVISSQSWSTRCAYHRVPMQSRKTKVQLSNQPRRRLGDSGA